MRFTNVSGMPAAWTTGFRRDGREILIVMIKVTYTLPENGQAPAIASEQVALVEADRFTGEPGLSAPLYETDFAHGKPACDLLLVGSAHAPGGRPAERVPAGFQVGSMFKQLSVIGDRFWQKRWLGIEASSPEPFIVMPISYDRAYGGTDRTKEEEGNPVAYLPNPVGRGYWRYTDLIDGQPLPNTEETARSVDSHKADYAPQSFSPIGRNWAPRSRYAGTYDQDWIETTAPLWPDDFDERCFQAAPADQIVPYLQGGERVVLFNLTPDGRRIFQLPAQAMPVTFIPYKGHDVTRQAQIDTLVLEPDAERFTMTWRCVLALGKSVFDVKETIAGEMSREWHRSRRFPGKPYYANLAELAGARRGA